MTNGLQKASSFIKKRHTLQNGENHLSLFLSSSLLSKFSFTNDDDEEKEHFFLLPFSCVHYFL